MVRVPACVRFSPAYELYAYAIASCKSPCAAFSTLCRNHCAACRFSTGSGCKHSMNIKHLDINRLAAFALAAFSWPARSRTSLHSCCVSAREVGVDMLVSVFDLSLSPTGCKSRPSNYQWFASSMKLCSIMIMTATGGWNQDSRKKKEEMMFAGQFASTIFTLRTHD